jgi:hypothetical protein
LRATITEPFPTWRSDWSGSVHDGQHFGAGSLPQQVSSLQPLAVPLTRARPRDRRQVGKGSPAGRLAFVSAGLPGSTHDLTAARDHGLIDALASASVMTFADKACQGAGGTVRTPFKRHHHRPPLSRNQKEVNRAHARIRGIGERAIATLKTWKLLARLHCCPQRATALLAAILAL